MEKLNFCPLSFLDGYSKVPEGIPEKLGNSHQLTIESGEYHQEGENYVLSPTIQISPYISFLKKVFNKDQKN